MAKSLNIICKNCDKTFKMNQNRIKERLLPGGLVETYFTCPHCKMEFHVCLTNVEIRELKSKLDKDMKHLVKLAKKDKEIPIKLSNEVLYLRGEIKRQMDVLNRK